MKKTMISLLVAVACAAPAASFAQAAQPDRVLLKAAQARKDVLVKDMATLINIDSGTDDAKGLGQVEAMLAQRLKDVGASVEIVAAPPAAGKMVVGKLQGTGSKNIMLMIHYDTVFGTGEAAKRPFKIVGNKAYGPGVADAKSGALLIVYALDIARERGFKNYKTLTVLFNPDEEKSSLGSRDMIAKLSADQDYVLVFEPPEADVVTVATNGIAYVHLDVKGRASHAGSAPEAGRNAAIELSNQIIQLKDLGSAAKGTTVSWTVIQAGDRVNIIPEKASATADMRMSDVSELQRVQADADRIVQKHLIPDTEVTVKVENRRPPFSRNAATDRLAATADGVYKELGKSIKPLAMRYGTDAGFAYHPGAARPVVLDGMGIVGDRIHSSDEWADLDSIVPRLYLTVRMLEVMGKAKKRIRKRASGRTGRNGPFLRCGE
jgi:glutamate carboxypeptidase